MKISKEFIKDKIKTESDSFFVSESKTLQGQEYVTYKKQGEWFCTCKGYQVRKVCSHIEKVLKPIIGDDKCFNCGASAWSKGGLDSHHVERRSISPERVNDASNIMLLCRKCHERATNDKKFEEQLKQIWDKLKN